MKAVKTNFFEPYKENKAGALVSNLPFLDSSKEQSGVYFIKSKRTGKIIYIGYSEVTLYRTVFRHFQKWVDIQRAVKTRFTYSKTGYTVRVIFTTSKRAAMLEKYLILKHSPRDNGIKYENYLTAAQQASCETILNDTAVLGKYEESPF